jgi:type VI protein secretion system component Hcp
VVVGRLEHGRPRRWWRRRSRSGQHLQHVVLTVDRPGGSHLPYLEITLTDALITSVQPSGANDELPLEQVSFAYRNIALKYTTVNDEVVQTEIEDP